VRRPRLGIAGRLALTMSAIAVGSVTLSMALAYDAMGDRLDRLAQAHVQSSAVRVAAIAARLHETDAWSPIVLDDLRQRAGAAGFDITLTDTSGRRLTGGVDRPGAHRPTAGAGVRVDGRTVGRLTLRQVGADVFAAENRALHGQLKGLLALCAALALALGLAAAVLLATTFVRPLRRLTEAAERMSRGELSARARHRDGGGVELAKLATTLNGLAATLAREHELRRAAAADIAHELRTPVTGIVSRIEAAQDGVMYDDAANLEAMHAEALRLAHLIDDVGQLADAERSGLLIAKRPVDLAAVAQARALAHAGFFAAKEITFERELEPVHTHGDARRLEQVVDNLLSNALRYTDPGGRVVLAVRGEPGAAVVEVRDTGIGISAEDLPRVFDRFWRSDRSRSRATGGSGVGLAVVRELVRAHHGEVELRSQAGQGTTARVVLPAVAGARSDELLAATSG
jgi:two-component system, OmpR family, sensor histidine kinase BaeS